MKPCNTTTATPLARRLRGCGLFHKTERVAPGSTALSVTTSTGGWAASHSPWACKVNNTLIYIEISWCKHVWHVSYISKTSKSTLKKQKSNLEVRPNAIVEVWQTVSNEQNFGDCRRRGHTSKIPQNRLMQVHATQSVWMLIPNLPSTLCEPDAFFIPIAAGVTGAAGVAEATGAGLIRMMTGIDRQKLRRTRHSRTGYWN